MIENDLSLKTEIIIHVCCFPAALIAHCFCNITTGNPTAAVTDII